jgi:hypothetical protein
MGYTVGLFVLGWVPFSEPFKVRAKYDSIGNFFFLLQKMVLADSKAVHATYLVYLC